VELTYISAKVEGVFIKLSECGLDYILILIKYRVLCKFEPSTHDPTAEILFLMCLNREATITPF
jgi:hypothetical protein